MSNRLAPAIFVSLLGHAVLAAWSAGGTAAPGTAVFPLTAPLTAALLAPTEAAPRAVPPRASLAGSPVPKVERSRDEIRDPLRHDLPAVAAVASEPAPEPTLVTAPVSARVTEPVTEPGSVMTLPRQGQIRYALLQGGQLVGHRVEEWRHDGSTYAIESRTELSGPAGSMLAQSSGIVSSDGLVPLAFHDEARGEVVKFDWQALRAVVALTGEPPITMALHGDTQDRLSLPYQIGQAMVHDKRLAAAVASGGGLLRESFEVVSEEQTMVAGVDLPSLHVHQRANNPDTDSPDAGLLELWLSLDGQYLPLRIRRFDRLGREFDQIAEKIDYAGMR